MAGMAQENDQLQHVMTTLLACREAVNDSMPVSERQQGLLVDIDASVRFLYSCFAESLPDDNSTTEAQTSPIAAMPDATATASDVESGHALTVLRSLYRVYYAYLHSPQDKGVSGFVTRFNDVVLSLNEVQAALEGESYVATRSPVDQVKEFIADLYYIFLDFLKAVSEILEANDIHIETEELAAVRDQIGETGYFAHKLYDFARLARVHQAHQQLDRQYNTIKQHVITTKALLVFLEETVDPTLGRREEVVKQLRDVDQLLWNLFVLLNDYERAATVLLQQK